MNSSPLQPSEKPVSRVPPTSTRLTLIPRSLTSWRIASVSALTAAFVAQ